MKNAIATKRNLTTNFILEYITDQLFAANH